MDMTIVSGIPISSKSLLKNKEINVVVIKMFDNNTSKVQY